MSSRMFDVIYSGQCKRMRIELQPLDEVRKALRKRFHQLEEDFSIQASLADKETKYDITVDEDLHDIFSDIEKLHISAKSIIPITTFSSEDHRKQFVEIDGVTYHVGVPMPEDSPLVKKFIEEYQLGDFFSETKALVEIVSISYMATISCGETQLISEMQDIGYSVAKLINHTRFLMTEYVRASSRILESFQSAVLFMYENCRHEALLSYARVGENVDRCDDWTKRVITEIDDITKKIEQTYSKIGNDRIPETEKKINEASDNLSKTGRELKKEYEKQLKIDADIASKVERSAAAEKGATEAAKNASSANKMHNIGSRGAAVVSCATSGIALAFEGTSMATTGAVVGAAGVACFAVFLGVGLVGGIGFLFHQSKKNKFESEVQSNVKELEGKVIEKEELKKKLIDLRESIKQLGKGVDTSKNFKECLEHSREEIKKIKIPLGHFQLGWKEIGDSCRTIDASKGSIEQMFANDNCGEVAKTSGFKYQVVKDFARWVALKHFAKRCDESLKAEATKLENRLQSSRQTAIAEFNALKHTDFLQLTASEDLE